MEFDMDTYQAMYDAHGDLIMRDMPNRPDHDGIRHCDCKAAKWLREFEALYSEQIQEFRRRTARTHKRKHIA